MKKPKACTRCGKMLDGITPSFVHDSDCIVPYPKEIQSKLENLWFVYGNNGPKHTGDNHKFIQRHVEGRAQLAKDYSPTKECRNAVKQAINAG